MVVVGIHGCYGFAHDGFSCWTEANKGVFAALKQNVDNAVPALKL